jgi:hypothetical protein
MGRPSLYARKIEPYLDDITDMALSMTEEQIAKTLGVSYSTFREYKKNYPALNDSLKKGRAELVRELKSTLIKKAKGFNYEEKKIIKEHGQVVREEVYIKASVPDVAALNLLLKNYDADEWANDPQMMKLRYEELELQKMKFKEANW